MTSNKVEFNKVSAPVEKGGRKENMVIANIWAANIEKVVMIKNRVGDPYLIAGKTLEVFSISVN